jgi:hypothetical protein
MLLRYFGEYIVLFWWRRSLKYSFVVRVLRWCDRPVRLANVAVLAAPATTLDASYKTPSLHHLILSKLTGTENGNPRISSTHPSSGWTYVTTPLDNPPPTALLLFNRTQHHPSSRLLYAHTTSTAMLAKRTGRSHQRNTQVQQNYTLATSTTRIIKHILQNTATKSTSGRSSIPIGF